MSPCAGRKLPEVSELLHVTGFDATAVDAGASEENDEVDLN